MKTKLKLILSTLIPLAIFFAVISGCDEDNPTNPQYIDNPNVETFDSIEVEEDVSGLSYTGIDLLTGRTTNGLDSARDCSLQDRTNDGFDFYLQNGVYLLNDKRMAGYEIRFYRFDSYMSVYTFDTLSKVPGVTSFTPNYFTQDNTAADGEWGYFNAPFVLGSSAPVFCFWLKGKKDAGFNNSKDVYGIIQPREATDTSPGQAYDYRMSFRVRINTNAENDFREQILITQ
jgi:hypothetical protein